MTLIDSLPGIGGSAILLLFFAVVFGIIGVQMFSGVLQKQCVDNGIPLTYISLDSSYIGFCNKDNKCSQITNRLGQTNSYTCKDTHKNPTYIYVGNGKSKYSGLEDWDDIFYSLLQVFQIMTLQDWSRWLYDLAQRTGYVAVLFFVPLIFVVSFFALNLILAVIVHTYGKSKVTVELEEDNEMTLEEVDQLIRRATSKRNRAPVYQEITYENYERHIRSLKSSVRQYEQLFKEFNETPMEITVKKHELTRKKKLRIDTTRRDSDEKYNEEKDEDWNMQLAAIDEEVKKPEDDEYDLKLEDENFDEWQFSQKAIEQRKDRMKEIESKMMSFNTKLTDEIWRLAKPIKDDWLKNKPNIIKTFHAISTDELFEKVVIGVIILNTIILAIEWPTMSKGLRTATEALNYCFTALFTIELIVKFLGLGPQLWFFDRFNAFDAVIVLVSLIEIGFAGGSSSVGGAILAFRALRVLRVLRLLHQIRSLRVLLNSIVESFEPVFFLFLILSLFLFMFGVLGVQMFAGKVISLKEDSTFELFTRPWRFDTLWYSIITFMQLFSGDGWPGVMADAAEGTSRGAILVIIIGVIIGLYVFKNMFLAILLNRMGEQDEIQLLIDDLIIKAKRVQKSNKDKRKQVELKREFEKEVKKLRSERIIGIRAATKHKQRAEKAFWETKITGVSLNYFNPKHSFRIILHDKIINTDWFEWLINIIIIVNCILLALRNPHVKRNSKLGKTLYVFDIIFTIIFALESIAKIIAYGLYESKPQSNSNYRRHYEDNFSLPLKFGTQRKGSDDGGIGGILGSNTTVNEEEESKNVDEDEEEIKDWGPCKNAYLSSWWNRLDLFIVFIAIIGIIVPQVKFLRGLRAIRPIRVAIRIEQVQIVVKALIASLSNIFNGILFSFFIIFVLSIVGVHLFSGEYGRCVTIIDPQYEFTSPFDLVDVNKRSQCEDNGGKWITPGFNFDHVFVGLLTIYKVCTLSNWYEDLSLGMATNGRNRQPKPFNRPLAGLFFLLVVISGGFFLFNIIISVVVDSFNRIKREEEQNALLTQDQAIWVRTKRYLERFPLTATIKPPKHPTRLKIYNYIKKDEFEYFIIFCILLNTLFLMTQHESQPKSWENALTVIEIIFICIYGIEAIVKIIGYGWYYFDDYWNDFDLLIVVLSIFGEAFEVGGAAVFRLLRVARVVRLIKRAPVLRALFLTLVYALPSLMNIGILLLVMFFIYGIFGMEFFGKVWHNDGYGNAVLYDSNDGISKSNNFEYFGNVLLILYRTATNDNWGNILLAAGSEDNECSSRYIKTLNAGTDDINYECGNFGLSVLYFISFGIFGTLLFINLFIAVILDTYSDNIEFETRMTKLEVGRKWISTWKELDEKLNDGEIKGRIPVKAFIYSLKRSPVLIGLILESLGLRLDLEENTDDRNKPETKIDYSNIQLISRKSTDLYGRLDFVGPVNPSDINVVVTNDHINSIMKTRRLRVLCRLIHRGTMEETLVVFYEDALFAIASLIVGPEFKLDANSYDTEKWTHISDWWEEKIEEHKPTF